jgi:hypothetical protein
MAVQSVLPIAAGYVYKTRLQVTGEEPVFPVGCQLRAQVRPFVAAAHLAGTLTTENGGITRVDDSTVDLVLSEAITANIGKSKAVLDIVRVDVEPDEWLAVQVTLPVITPITVPEA